MSSPRARSRNSARAVRKMIGIPAVLSSSSSCSATRQPSRPGIITSRSTTSGACSRASARPLGPSAASSTSIPSASRLTRQSRRIGASSSITRTLVTELLYPGGRGVSPGGGQLEGERRSLPFARLDPDPPAHRGDEPAGDEEPEPGTAARAAVRLAAAVELAEDLLLLGLRNADPVVGDAHLDRVVLALDAHRHRAAVARVLERVVEQDREHLAQLVRIRVRRERLVRQ